MAKDDDHAKDAVTARMHSIYTQSVLMWGNALPWLSPHILHRFVSGAARVPHQRDACQTGITNLHLSPSDTWAALRTKVHAPQYRAGLTWHCPSEYSDHTGIGR